MSKEENLRASAGASLIWGVGFTLARDVVQFLAMLVMVRLLSPQIYGQQALAQTIIGFLAVASMKTISNFPLQAREPDGFDWDAHFTACTALNFSTFVLTNIVAFVILAFGGAQMTIIGQVVAFMSPLFILEIACTYHVAWLQAHHRWGRLRLLLVAGSITGASLGILLAWMGWGVFALASTNLLFGLPTALDFVLLSKHRPKFAISRLRDYKDGVKFGLNRGASSSIQEGRSLIEQSAMSAFFGFAVLGSYSRAIGLAQITTGRIGPVVTGSLYSVLTRAEASSERFQRFAALLFRGVAWTSVPAAAFLAVEAPAIVSLLYGARWESVIPLMAMASALLALKGCTGTLYQTMLANLQTSACLRFDILASIIGVTAVLATLAFGVSTYLLALLCCQIFLLFALGYLGWRGGAIKLGALLYPFVPCLAATGAASLLVIALPHPAMAPGDGWASQALILTLRAGVFGVAYLLALCTFAPKAVVAVLDALPIYARVRNIFTRLLSTRPANP